MPITIDASIGGAAANSYLTLIDAETFFLGRPFADDWNNATEGEQDIVLAAATRRLDQEKWKGIPTSTTQALKWPRSGVENADYQYGAGDDSYGGVPLWAPDEIPQWLKDAQCELAIVLLAENLLEDTGLELMESVSVGDLSVTPMNSRHAGRLPENVQRYIKDYVIGGGNTVRLLRS